MIHGAHSWQTSLHADWVKPGRGGEGVRGGKRGWVADLLHSKVAVSWVSRLVMRTQARCQAA